MAGKRWNGLLFACCVLSACWAVFAGPDLFGIGQFSWYGWWQSNMPSTGRPYEARFDSVEPGSPPARAGIRDGDTIDLRQQSLEARVGLAFQPIANKPLTLVIGDAGAGHSLTVLPGTVWVTGLLGLVWAALGVIAALWFAACALLISLRRSDAFEGRMLALALALCVPTTVPLVLPNAVVTLALLTASLAGIPLVWLLIAVLSAAFGERSLWRTVLQYLAYAACAVSLGIALTFTFGIAALRFDPMVPGILTFGSGALGLETICLGIMAAFVIGTAVAGVATTARPDRARAAWLLLPLPIGLLAAGLFFQLESAVPASWALTVVFQALSAGSSLLAAFAVSYALLKRRVLDFEFVLGRTLVFTSVSLIVVAAFVILEYVLGAVLSDASHATGVVANVALALVLGVSMRYIHKRVDTFVEAVLFRKRRENERALRDFSHEAAYVTEPEALLDQAIDAVRRHTDARSAWLMLDGDGRYAPVRAYGSAVQEDANENDGALVALRARHEPLDPHHYRTVLNGALAVPLVSRGRLVGVLLMGERAGGEAYAPDEVQTLLQLAHGVGTALDSFAGRKSDAEISSLLQALVARQDAVIAELQALRGAIRVASTPTIPQS